tara:strand:+ start:985 stop:1242 length:258 start_codon:yes stop_codon:yes gene_type:complete
MSSKSTISTTEYLSQFIDRLDRKKTNKELIDKHKFFKNPLPIGTVVDSMSKSITISKNKGKNKGKSKGKGKGKGKKKTTATRKKR